MPIQIKNLLADAVKRAQNRQPIEGARIIDEVNRYLLQMLPLARNRDAKVISYRDKILMVACLNGAVASFVAQRRQEILNHLKQVFPEYEIERIQTRVMKKFPEKDFMVE